MPDGIISADARKLAVGHAFEHDEDFLGRLTAALADLSADAAFADRADALRQAASDRVRILLAERDAADANGRVAGAKAERERIKAILTAPEAEGRRPVAEALAFSSSMPVAAAIEALKIAPQATASWMTNAPARAIPDRPLITGLRSHEAPGGLVTMPAPGSASARVELAAGVVISEPEQPRASRHEAMRRRVVDSLNAGFAAAPPAPPAPAAPATDPNPAIHAPLSGAAE